jgi:hypothetical protein
MLEASVVLLCVVGVCCPETALELPVIPAGTGSDVALDSVV